MGPSDGEAAFQLVLQGRAIEAQAKCRRIRKSDPDNPYLLVIEGLAQAEAGRFDQAEDLLVRALELDPENWAGHFVQGEWLIHAQQYDRAYFHLIRLAALKPSSLEACMPLAKLESAGYPSTDSLFWRQREVAISPKSVPARLVLGNAFLAASQFEAARDHYAAAGHLAPHMAEPWINLAAALGRMSEFSLSITAAAKGAALAPEMPQALANLGRSLDQHSLSPQALDIFERVVRVTPGDPQAHSNLALAQFARGFDARARDHLQQAIHLQSDHAEYHINLSSVMERQKDYERAIRAACAGICLDPKDQVGLNNLAVSLQSLCLDDLAIGMLDRAIAIDPAYVDGHFNRGTSYLRIGRLQQGWADYEYRLKTKGHALEKTFDARLWDGSRILDSQTILLYAEQGLGDTIQFMRYALALKSAGARVIVSGQAALKRLFSSHVTYLAPDDPIPPIDFYAPLLSLPHLLARYPSGLDIPTHYVVRPQDLTQHWQSRLGPPGARRIGMTVMGNPNHANDLLRSMPLTFVEGLFMQRDLEFHLIQKSAPPAVRDLIQSHPNVVLHDALIDDLADTAAILGQMDLVIAVDTSILHLAGAMGLRAYGLLAYAPDWRWQTGSTRTDWYPTISLIRQSTPGDWPGVVAMLSKLIAD